MRKFFGLFVSIITIFSCFVCNRFFVNADEELDLNTCSAVLMEPVSKRVIYSKNPNEKLYPASMTKMMGLYLILESVEEGRISFSDEVVCSSYASSMGGTQIYLEENEKMSVEDLFKAVCINSANDAIVALGEYVASSNDSFVKMMNEKAREFGMNNTHFCNATGFDDPNHYTTSYDMALLGSYLVGFGDKILKYTSLTEGYVRESSEDPFWLVNTNKLLRYYDGLDGLKTGFTQKAGYNLTATAERNGVRLVSTVMNLDTIAHRSQDTIRLLDYGFSKLKAISLFDSGEIVSTFEIDSSLNRYLSVITNQDIKVVLNKNEKEEDVVINAVLDSYEGPFYEGDVVGYLEIKTPSGSVFKYNLYASNSVEEITFFAYLLNFMKKLFA